MTRLRERLVEFKDQFSESGLVPRKRVSPASYLFCYRPAAFGVNSTIDFIEDALSDKKLQEDKGSWSQLPEALLCIIFSKLETTKTDWTSVRSLYAASGVCKSWRKLTMPLILRGLWQKPAHLQLIHPIQLFSLNPSDEAKLIKCTIVRKEISGTIGSSFVRFSLYVEPENDESERKFLFSATQHTWQQTSIYLNQAGCGIPCAKLTSNVLGTTHKLTRCAGSVFPVAMSEPNIGSPIPSADSLASVKYKLRMKGMMRPRRLNVLLPLPPGSIESDGRAKSEQKLRTKPLTSTNSLINGIGRHKSERQFNSKSFLQRSSTKKHLLSVPHLKLVNKPPHWNEALKCWCLNFRGRVKKASVKNFQLTCRSDAQGKVVMQFGKVDANSFILDFNPSKVSAIQAFSIALTSFEGRVLL
eukprot:g4795.t1